VFKRLRVNRYIRTISQSSALTQADKVEKAVIKLGELGDSRSIPYLIEALMGGKQWVRLYAARSLAKLGEPKWAECFKGDDEDFHRLAITDDVQKIDFFIKAVSRGDLSIQGLSLGVLGRCKDPRAFEVLVRSVEDQTIGSSALLALGWFGDTRAFDKIVSKLRTDDKLTRACAVEALGMLGDARAFEFVLKALDDVDFVRNAAIIALGALGDERASDPLMARLRDEKGRVNFLVAAALGMLRQEHVIAPLTEISLGHCPKPIQAMITQILLQFKDSKNSTFAHLYRWTLAYDINALRRSWGWSADDPWWLEVQSL
jgi:HEAT repeat protein